MHINLCSSMHAYRPGVQIKFSFRVAETPSRAMCHCHATRESFPQIYTISLNCGSISLVKTVGLFKRIHLTIDVKET